MSNTLEFYTRATSADSQLKKDELPMQYNAHVVFQQGDGAPIEFGSLLAHQRVENPVPEAAVNLRIGTQPSHISYIGVQWTVRWSDGDSQELHRTRKELRINGGNIRGPIECVMLNCWAAVNDTATPAGQPEAGAIPIEETVDGATRTLRVDAATVAASTGLTEEAVIDLSNQGLLHRITVTFATTPLAALNVVVEATHGEFTAQFVALQEMIAGDGDITAHVTFKSELRNISPILDQVASLIDADSRSRIAKSTSLSTWWSGKAPNPQLNMGLKPDGRPKVRIPLAFTMSSLDEYVTILYYGIVPQIELVQERVAFTDEVRVRLCEIAHAGNRRYWAFLEPIDGMRLEVDDKIGLNFRLTDGSSTDAWAGTVMETPPFAPWGDTAVMLSRKWVRDASEQDGGHFDDLELPREGILAVSAQTTPDNVRAALTTGRCILARISMTDSDLPLRHQLAGVNQLWLQRGSEHGQRTAAMLLGNSPAWVPASRAFSHLVVPGGLTTESVANAIQEVLDAAQLDGAQQQPLLALQHDVPGGLQIIHGGAGTGKSKTALQAICVAFLLRRLGRAGNLTRTKTRILVTCPSNEYTNEVFRNIHREAVRICGEDDVPCIVRAHAMTTDRSVATNRATQARNAGAPPSAQRPIQEEPNLILDELEGARDLLERYREHVHREADGIRDRRLQIYDHSLGARVLQVTGAQLDDGAPHRFAPPDWETRFARFREYLGQWERNEHFEKEDVIAFRAAYVDALSATLGEVAEVVVTTTAQALGPTMHERFTDIDWVVVEELGRVSEGEFAALCALYEPHHTLAVGDVFQLPPVIKIPKGAQYFESQHQMSPLTRLIGAGYRQYELAVQHRSHDSITQLLRKIAYPNVATGPGVAARPSSARIEHIFRELFKVRPFTTVMWLETAGSTEIDSRFSAFNDHNVAVGMYWLARLLACGIAPADVLIVAPYKAQISLYAETLRKFREWLPTQSAIPQDARLEEVRLATFDNVQGTEGSIVIMDTTVSEKIGFLKVRNRMVTGISRAVDGLIMLGSNDILEASVSDKQQYARSALAKACDYCRKINAYAVNAANHALTDELAGLIEARKRGREDALEPLRIESEHPPAQPTEFDFNAAQNGDGAVSELEEGEIRDDGQAGAEEGAGAETENPPAQPRGFELNAAQPTGFELNAAQPTGFELNAAQPTGFELNAAQPTGFELNAAQPTGFELNAAQPTGFELNAAQPTGFEFNAVQSGDGAVGKLEKGEIREDGQAGAEEGAAASGGQGTGAAREN
jgi:hypothetical protein